MLHLRQSDWQQMGRIFATSSGFFFSSQNMHKDSGRELSTLFSAAYF
jgi:hypothetical protein